MKKFHLMTVSYILVSIALLLFSYTQVDLNLTLSRASIVQSVQKSFQYVGFYQRPLATFFYALILVALYALYGFTLNAAKKGALSTSLVWRLLMIVGGILVFAYPAAFSYDFFNYLFTAKTVLVYHQNPYVITPLQFSGIDPWTNFMRWTHLTSAYTPLWIGMSLVPYLFGLGYFVLVLFSMKFLIAGFFVLACWAMTRTAVKPQDRESAYTLAAFALHPLLLIETLVSGHNDIVLVAFALLAVGLYVKKSYTGAWLLLSLSIAAKFMTIFLLPVFILKRGKFAMLLAMILGLILVLLRREFLPWYWVWVLPFVVLNIRVRGLLMAFSIVSFGLAASYAPYLYFGEYSPVEQLAKTSIIWSGVGIAVASLLVSSGARVKRAS